jgi:hypothetical protein
VLLSLAERGGEFPVFANEKEVAAA